MSDSVAPRRPLEVPPLTPAERAARGKAARLQVPRSSHAAYESAPSRPDPVALLEEQAASRVPELVPIRYGRMLVSPFTFFRGAALIMASDLATTPTSGLTVQACGDAHLSNFGVFASPERSLVLDVNDFDETLPGPWEWDVKRLAASVEIACRERGFLDKDRRQAVLASAESYRTGMRQFAQMGNLEVWYSRLNVDDALAQVGSQLTKVVRARSEKLIAKAKTRDSMDAFNKLTTVVDGKARIVSNPPTIVPIEELFSSVENQVFRDQLPLLLVSYQRTLQEDRRHLLDQFRFVQMARKVVGVGSVGTRAWIVLMAGRDDGDPLFLQVKEAQASVLERFTHKSIHRNSGQRVVAGQHLMQASSDIFLGWQRVEKAPDGKQRDFYVRQLRDWKGSIDTDSMLPAGLLAWARLCGWTLARAHARSGDRIAIASYLGQGLAFDQAIASFAETYAEQNQRDYEALRDAVAAGRVTAETGV
jgi:uncharacterized protein (DUF2252 family)